MIVLLLSFKITTLNNEIRMPLQFGCRTPRKLPYKPSKSINISTNTSICTHTDSRVPITLIINSKVIYSCAITINIYIVWNVEKLVKGNLISLFSVKVYKLFPTRPLLDRDLFLWMMGIWCQWFSNFIVV